MNQFIRCLTFFVWVNLLFLSTNVFAQSKKRLGKELCQIAKQYIGVPYQYGGNSPSGFDCSGYTKFVFDKKNISLTRTAKEQAQIGKKIRKRKAQQGDLLFFKNKGKISHVGIVVSKKRKPLQMIHASSSKGVIITDIESSNYWKKRLRFARRIL